MESEKDPRLQEQTDATTGEEVTPETQDSPDEETSTGVEAAEGGQPGDQGQWVEQQAIGATGFNPDAPRRTSPPPADWQSGVPGLEGGGNEDVEPNEEMRGSVDPAQADPGQGEGDHGTSGLSDKEEQQKAQQQQS